MTREWLQPVPRSIVWDLLQLKMEQIKSGKLLKMPYEYCVVSYLFDMQSSDGVKTCADYARIWGWSDSWVRHNINKIRTDAESQASFGRTEEKTIAVHTKNDQKVIGDCDECDTNGDMGTETQSENDSASDDLHTDCTQKTIEKRSYISESLDQEEIPLSARGEDGLEDAHESPFDPVALYRDFYPHISLTVYQVDLIRTKARDPTRWRSALEYWAGNDYLGKNVQKIIQRYDELAAPTYTDPLDLIPNF